MIITAVQASPKCLHSGYLYTYYNTNVRFVKTLKFGHLFLLSLEHKKQIPLYMSLPLTLTLSLTLTCLFFGMEKVSIYAENYDTHMFLT